MNPEGGIAEAARAIARARRITVLTGAGASAECGLRTFRDEGGQWRQHDPMSLATPEAFAADPELVWEFYSERRQLAFAAEPGPAHRALVELERRFGEGRFLSVTQNVDGLLERAGSERTITLHGSLRRVRCSRGCSPAFVETTVPWNHPTPCVRCGAALRPDVVWFGEALDLQALQRAFDFAASSDVVLVVGTSGAVEPAASVARVREAGSERRLIEVNPEPTALSDLADIMVRSPAGAALPELVARSHVEA